MADWAAFGFSALDWGMEVRDEGSSWMTTGVTLIADPFLWKCRLRRGWAQEMGMQSPPEVTEEQYKFRPNRWTSVPGEPAARRRVDESVHLLSRILEEHTERKLWQQTRGVHLCLCVFF